MKCIRTLIYACLFCAFLCACGGGGGGEVGGAVVAGINNSWLSFSPSLTSISMKEGDLHTFSINARSSKTIPEKINIAIVDMEKVLDSAVGATSITALNTTNYVAKMTVSRTLTPKTYRGNLVVKICLDEPIKCNLPYPGSPWLVPYEITVMPWQAARTVHKLLISDAGVAFTKTPEWARLTKAVQVPDNLGSLTSWKASSNQVWLKVTPSGTTGAGINALNLVADSSSLPLDAVSYAIVTITADDASISQSEKITVGLWKGSVTPTISRKIVTSYPGFDPELTADPVRPYIYSSGGREVVDAYNIYTGVKVASYSVPGASFHSMVVSPDGANLYAVDAKTTQIRVFDLNSGGALRASWPVDAHVVLSASELYWLAMRFIRTNGVGFLALSNGQIFRVSDGKVVYPVKGAPEIIDKDFAHFLLVTSDGTRIISTGGSVKVDYSEVNDGTFSILRVGLGDNRLSRGGGYGKSTVALSNDNLTLYTPGNYSGTGESVRAEDFLSLGYLPPNPNMTNKAGTFRGDFVAVATSSDGRVLCGGNYYYKTFDAGTVGRVNVISLYSPGGAFVKSMITNEIHKSSSASSEILSLIFSSDSFMAASNAKLDPMLDATGRNSDVLVLTPVGP